MQRVRGVVRSARSLQSRQGAADAAALRRSAGAVPRASGRTRRARRALLMIAAAELIASGHALDTRAADPVSDRVDGVVPGVIVSPKTAAAVAATLQWASARRLSVVIRGQGRRRLGRRRRPRSTSWSSMSALNRILTHQAGDLTATVEAGMPSARLESAARAASAVAGARSAVAGTGDDRRPARDQRQRPAAPSVRHAARPRDRHPARDHRRRACRRPAARSSRTSPATICRS